MLSFTLMLTAAHAQTLPFDKIDAFKKDCWAQYLKRITEDPQRQKEMAESAIPYKNSVMKFALYQIGDEPTSPSTAAAEPRRKSTTRSGSI